MICCFHNPLLSMAQQQRMLFACSFLTKHSYNGTGFVFPMISLFFSHKPKRDATNWESKEQVATICAVNPQVAEEER